MTDLNVVDNSKKQLELLIAAATNPRDKAFIALLAGSGMRITEAISIKVTDIDFINGTLSILHLKARTKLKCPNCGELLGKRHFFCPGCGNKVSHAVREQVEQRRHRTIPIDNDTLALIKKYLKWRRQFSYHGPLLFPFHPPTRLATDGKNWPACRNIWTSSTFISPFISYNMGSQGLDVKKLQILLGHASIATTMAYVDTNFDQLQSEYEKLWDDNDDDGSKE